MFIIDIQPSSKLKDRFMIDEYHILYMVPILTLRHARNRLVQLKDQLMGKPKILRNKYRFLLFKHRI